MSIQFSRGFLCVGYRKRNFKKVFYKPHLTDGEPEADDTLDVLLFHKPGAKADEDNPILSEVNWKPHFNPTTFDADDKKGRDYLHRWFLYRCWQYLAAKNDMDAMEALNRNQFAGDDYNRWDTWVIDASRWRRRRYGPGAVIGERLTLPVSILALTNVQQTTMTATRAGLNYHHNPLGRIDRTGEEREVEAIPRSVLLNPMPRVDNVRDATRLRQRR